MARKSHQFGETANATGWYPTINQQIATDSVAGHAFWVRGSNNKKLQAERTGAERTQSRTAASNTARMHGEQIAFSSRAKVKY